MSTLLFLIQVLVAQGVVIALIVFVLKKILDRQLIESAVKKLETMDFSRLGAEATELTVTTHKALNPKTRNQISAVLNRKAEKFQKTIRLVEKVDPTLKGGILLILKDVAVDHSLASRLKESGLFQ